MEDLGMNPAFETDPVLVDERMFYAEIKPMIKALWREILSEAELTYDAELSSRRKGVYCSAIPVLNNQASIVGPSMTVASVVYHFRSPDEFFTSSNDIKRHTIRVLKQEKARKAGEMHVLVTIAPATLSYEVCLMLPFEREEAP
jgi:hypothetical protein